LNDHGQLGYPNTDDVGDNETPDSVGTVDLGRGSTATHIAAGNFHTCAILDDKTTLCWGWGALGRLGYANEDDVGDEETPGSVGPVDIGEPATAITAGANHTVVVLASGRVRSWGLGTSGELGYPEWDIDEAVGNYETPSSEGPVKLGGWEVAGVIHPF
jgi:alpha-tubulin suppressor-like RCC1 family protein